MAVGVKTRRRGGRSPPRHTTIGVSAPPTPGMLHLGIGNFHRAHAAVYTAKAMAAQGGDWGIVAVANRSRRVVDSLAGQGFLYSILELSSAGERVDVMDVHRETLVASEQTAELMARIASPEIKIVTMTISENGYCRNAVTGDLDVDGDLVSADLANPAAPRTSIGQLAGALIRRYQGDAGPLTILSCDNLVSAGHTAQIEIEVGQVSDSPARRNAALDKERQRLAYETVVSNPFVQALMQAYDAKIVPGSIALAPR